MVLRITLILMLLALYFVFRSQRRRAALSVSVAIVLIYLASQGYVAHHLLETLQSDPRIESPTRFRLKSAVPKAKQKNLIIVFGIGSVEWNQVSTDKQNPEDIMRARSQSNLLGFSRLFQARNWWQELKAAGDDVAILVSGGDPHNKGYSEAEVMKLELMRAGVPADQIFLEKKSRNTYQNAQFSAKWIQDFKSESGRWDQIWLMTSGFHMKRSKTFLSHFGVEAIAAPSDRIVPQVSMVPLALNLAYTDLALHEFGGLLLFFVFELLGLNQRP